MTGDYQAYYPIPGTLSTSNLSIILYKSIIGVGKRGAHIGWFIGLPEWVALLTRATFTTYEPVLADARP